MVRCAKPPAVLAKVVMIRLERSALLMKSANFMFDMINDVDAYPQYMQGCEAAEVISADHASMTARLKVRKAGLSHSFTTRNELLRPSQIKLELVEGPFSRFSGQWSILELNDNACKVALLLEFAINKRLAVKPLEALFKSVGDELVDAVCRRAGSLSDSEVYAPVSTGNPKGPEL